MALVRITGKARLRIAGLLAAVLIVAAIFQIVGANAAVPLPSPLIKVRTTSGNVVKTTAILPLGAPVAIDVDNSSGADIAVAVGLIDLSTFPRLLVPNVIITRPAGSFGKPSPDVKVEVEIDIRDLANGLKRLALVRYGYETPPGGSIPPRVKASMDVILSGIDPLKATIDAGGYRGPLDIDLGLDTPDLDGDFDLDFDPLPQTLSVVEDPQDDGLELTVAQSGAETEVDLNASASLQQPSKDKDQTIKADIARLPKQIDVTTTTSKTETFVDYLTVPEPGVAKPDVVASVLAKTLGDNPIEQSALDLNVAGLPEHITGTIGFAPSDDPAEEDTLSLVDLDVIGAGQIDAVDVDARGRDKDTAATLPELPKVGSDQFVAATARPLPEDETKLHAHAHLEGLKRVKFSSDEATGLNLNVDIGGGDGVLRAFADLDNRRADDTEAEKEKTFRLRADGSVTPLPSTITVVQTPGSGDKPTTLTYDADRTIDVDAELQLAGGSAENCGEAEVVCARASVDRIPGDLDLSLPTDTVDDFSLIRNGAAPAGGTDVRTSADITGAPEREGDAPKRTVFDARIDDVPAVINGRLRLEDKDLREAEFHACTFDFEERKCRDDEGGIGRLDFRLSDQPGREGLPPKPALADRFVSVARRFDRFEVEGSVADIRHVALHQRPSEQDAEKKTVGVQVEAGAEDPFDVSIDELTTVVDEDAKPLGDAHKRVDVHVDELPRAITACIRPDREGRPEKSGDALLAACETSRLPGDEKESEELDTTPLTVDFKAEGRPNVEARVTSTEPDLENLAPNGVPRPKTQELRTGVTQLPDSLHADVVAPLEQDDRPLTLEYTTAGDAAAVDFDVRKRRDGARCGDPRPGREATCAAGRIRNLSDSLFARVDNREDKQSGDKDTVVDVDATRAQGRPLTSIDNLRLDLTSSDPETPPVSVDADITDIPDRLQTVLHSKRPTGADGEKAELQEADFNACFEKNCDGVGAIDFTLLAGREARLLPDLAPLAAPAPGADHAPSLDLVQRGEDVRAEGRIEGLRRVFFSKLDADGRPQPTTRLRARFGDPGDEIALRVQRQQQAGTEAIEGKLSDAQLGVVACIRTELEDDEEPVGDDGDVTDEGAFCERAAAGETAFQARFDKRPTASARPDIAIDKLEIKRAGITKVTGSIGLEDLGERIDVRAATEGGTEVLIEGLTNEDDPQPADAVGKVTFNLTNDPSVFEDTAAFPFAPGKNAGKPENESRAQGNHLVVGTDDTGRFAARGAIPHVRRVALTPDRCDADDKRFPDAAGFPSDATRPTYACLDLDVGGNEPLALAFRQVKPPEIGADDSSRQVLAIEDGFLTRLPDRLTMTIAKSPEAAAEFDVCAPDENGNAPQLPCRPPLISAEAPDQAAGEPTLEARLTVGPEDALLGVIEVRPQDFLSKRLNYERAPRKYGSDGVRLKIGTNSGDAGYGPAVAGQPPEEPGFGETVIRGGLRLPLHRFLDIDPPTLYACDRLGSSPDCVDDGVAAAENKGTSATDVLVRIAAADKARYAGDVATLGRLALFVHDFGKSKDIVLTGAPDAPHDPSGAPFSNENPPPRGIGSEATIDDADTYDLGATLPGHLDMRVFIRNDFNARVPGKTGVPNPNDNQIAFVQLDGRVSAPLTAAVRLNDPPGDSLVAKNRNGDRVPDTAATLRKAPGDLEPADGYAAPTFRLRFEGRTPFTPLPDPPPCKLINVACVTTTVETNYVDVAFHFKPLGGNVPPARTVDAVLDIVPGTEDVPARNDLDIKSYAVIVDKNVTGGGDPDAPASMLPQATLRLAPFQLVDLTTLPLAGSAVASLDGDLVAAIDTPGSGASLNPPERLQLSHSGLGFQFESKQGRSTVRPDLRGEFKGFLGGSVLIPSSLILPILWKENFTQAAPVPFRSCPLPNDGDDGINLIASNNQRDTLYMGVDNLLSTFADGDPLDLDDPRRNTASLLLRGALRVFCGKLVKGTSQASLVDGAHPSPRFVENERDVPGSPAPPPLAGGTAPAEPEGDDVTIDADATVCGAIGANELTIARPEAGGEAPALRVGREGEEVTLPPALGSETVTCDGTLTLEARKITIGPGVKIDASATISTPGPGTPSPSIGGGAGHGEFVNLQGTHIGGRGGESGAPNDLGDGGPGYGPDQGDAGSPGAAGTTTAVLGGRGGGAISISASETVNVNSSAVIDVSGGAGGDTDACSDGLPPVGGGGGSGGTITIGSEEVASIGGALIADGGDGGSAGNPGGGGAGGLIVAKSLDSPGAGNTSLAGGAPGAQKVIVGGPTDCGLGKRGEDGEGPTLVTQHGVAEVVREDNTAPYMRLGEDAKLHVTARVASTASDLQMLVIVCARKTGPSQGFESSELQPPPQALHQTTENWLTSGINSGQHSCKGYRAVGKPGDQPVPSGGPVTEVRPGIWEADFTIDASDIRPLDADGNYSYYALVGSLRLVFGNIPDGQPVCSACREQEVAPQTAPVVFGFDETDPTVTALPEGEDCTIAGVEAKCVNGDSGILQVSVRDTPSGPGKVECRRENGQIIGIFLPCGVGPVVVRFPTRSGPNARDGFVHTRVRGFDRAFATPPGTANSTTIKSEDGDYRPFFVDRQRPQVKIALNENGDEANGIFNARPDLEIRALEPGGVQRTGFAANAIEVLVDGTVVGRCGGEIVPGVAGNENTQCSFPGLVDSRPASDPNRIDFPTEGVHKITARLVDRAGNEALPPKEVEMRVDVSAPSSTLVIDPRDPDGEDDVYRTRPRFDVAVSDGLGGVGVVHDSADPDVGVFVRVDGGDVHRYDPEAANELGEGSHEVCFYAVDLLGNEENGGDIEAQCQDGIRVDSTAPEVALRLDPEEPDGGGGFHVTRVRAEAGASDEGTEPTGVDRVEISVDRGDFRPAEVVLFDTGGEHSIRARAFDRAGNASDVIERTLKIDDAPPTARVAAFPPAPNALGWLRRERSHVVLGNDTRGGSGVVSATTQVDGGAVTAFGKPVVTGEGQHTVRAVTADLAGRQSAAATASGKTDTIAPTASLRSPFQGTILLGNKATARFTAADAGSPRVRVKVVVLRAPLLNLLDVLLASNVPVRTLDPPGADANGFRPNGNGEVEWDLKDDAGHNVGPGTYYFRVVAIDEAGNTASTSDGKGFLIAL